MQGDAASGCTPFDWLWLWLWLGRRLVDGLGELTEDAPVSGRHFSQVEERAEPAAGPVKVDLEAIRKIAAQLWLRAPAGGALCKERESPE